jgi:hypothetical protein
MTRLGTLCGVGLLWLVAAFVYCIFLLPYEGLLWLITDDFDGGGPGGSMASPEKGTDSTAGPF